MLRRSDRTYETVEVDGINDDAENLSRHVGIDMAGGIEPINLSRYLCKVCSSLQKSDQRNTPLNNGILPLTDTSL